jgi:hypothetical protein
MSEDVLKKAAIQAGIGAAAGVGTTLANTSAPHVRGVAGASANFASGVTKALKNHKGVAGALAAGTTAVVGTGAVGTAVVAALPVVAVAAAVGGAAFGVFKLVERFRNK